MKVLFIGGTGNISTAVSRMALEKGMNLWLLNRGSRKVDLPGVQSVIADINNPDEVTRVLDGETFDVVVNWIAFTPDDIERDIKLFAGRCSQYIFISSASAYQKPLTCARVTESTPLKNPYWEYSRDKIACENLLNQAYREQDFPMTIVRPSLTYDTVIPVAIGGWDDYGIIDRMKKGNPIIVHGDGSSLWTITHSDDFARGFLGLMGNRQSIGQGFHITSDEILTWDQIYQFTAAAAGVEANIVHIPSDFIVAEAKKLDQDWMEGNLLGDKAVSAIFDNSKLKAFVPDFVATIPYAEGIKRTVEWFEADESRMAVSDDNNKFMDTILAEYGKVFPPANG